MSGIRVAGLRKAYGSVEALRGIDLSVPNGTLLSVLGPSGCGKSTMLQLLAGFTGPTEGEIWADDQLLSSPRLTVPPEQRGISLVFQNYAVWPHMTVAQNVAFGLKIRRLSAAEIGLRLDKALRMVRLEALRDRYPGELSGGQQQRVALARALVVEPRFLLLDEPLSNLDANLREEMRFEIRRVHELLGITTIYVTHDQSEALVTADQVAVMKAGQVQQLGTPEDVFERPANAFVAAFIGNTNELRGTLEAPGRIRLGRVTLRGAERSHRAPGEAVSLCIRPSRVELGPGGGAPANTLPGRVVRSAYLGEHRDLLIDLDDDLTIRALVPPNLAFGAGEQVTVRLPIAHCQILAPSA